MANITIGNLNTPTNNSSSPSSSSSNGNNTHFYVIINNVAKKTNVGNMLRSCCAFNAKAMLVVGRKKQVTFFGSKGTKHHVPLYYFDSLNDAVEYARNDNCKICGVEILDQSLNVVKHPFIGPTCFLLGNEGDGLHEKEKKVCDFFVYIPHYGNGTASLNVNVAASIVFHHFAEFANYTERPREGQKFIVNEITRNKSKADGDGNNNVVVELSDYEKKIQNDRLAQKLKVENNIVDMSSGGISMFEEEGE